jgi:hypothetical protein
LDEPELAQYFGEANLGTGYLFIYNNSAYSSDSLIKSMMPDNWSPPAPSVPITPISSPTASMMVESEPKEREEPPIIASKEVDELEENISQSSILPSVSRLPNPRVIKPKPVGSQPSIIDTKRPSLPTVNFSANPGTIIISPGPATASAILENEDQKNSWGWFSKKEKIKK